MLWSNRFSIGISKSTFWSLKTVIAWAKDLRELEIYVGEPSKNLDDSVLAENPQLCAHVKRVTLAGILPSITKGEALLRPLTSVKHLTIESRRRFPVYGDMLPCLTSLYCDFGTKGPDRITPWDMIVKCLTTFSISAWYAIRISDPLSRSTQYALPSELYRSSSVTSLHFIACCLRTPNYVIKALKCIEKLKSFVYAPEGRNESYRYPLNPDFVKEVEGHAGTLEEMMISSSLISSEWDLAPTQPGLFSQCLIGFSKLKRLAIQESFLICEDADSYHEKLPQSLEVLQVQYEFTDSREGRERQVARLAAFAGNAVLPHFNRLIWFGRAQSKNLEEHRQEVAVFIPRLKEVFGKAGIQFEFVVESHLLDTPLGVEIARWDGRIWDLS